MTRVLLTQTAPAQPIDTAPAALPQTEPSLTRPVVLHLVDALELGGAERVVATLVTEMDAGPYRPRVLCLTRRGVVADELIERGVTIDLFGYEAHHRLREIGRLARWLRRHRVRILHTHGYSAGVLGRVAALLAGTPRVVAHFHTTDWGYRRRQRWIEWVLAHWTDRVVCCSEAVARFARSRCGVPLAKLSVIYNGIVQERFASITTTERQQVRRGLRLKPDEPIVAIIGSLTEQKGHVVAIEALVQLHRRGIAAQLLCVGEGPERGRIEARAAELDVASSVHCVGRQIDVAPWLAACDLVCAPSVMREGLGMAVIETMAAGKAVVASRLDGLPEVVEEGRSGLLVEPGDPAALADALALLLSEPVRRAAMGECGRERALRLFTAGQMASRMADLYRELDEQRAPTATHRATVLYTTCRTTLDGGGQQSLFQLVSHLDRQHFRPLVLCPVRGPLSEALMANGVEVMIEPLPRVSRRSALAALVATIRLIRLIRTRDVALVHTDHPRQTLYAGVAARLTRVPLVWHIRVSNGEWSDRVLLLLTSRLILVAAALRERFRLGTPRGRLAGQVSIIHNGVELHRPALPSRDRVQMRQSIGADAGTVVMIVVGRVERLKGAEVLMDALGRLRHDVPPFQLLFLGSADFSYEAELRSRAESAGVAERVRFLGYRSDVDRWISVSDIVVHPSLFEAFPRAILEGMAAAKPVIASDVGGIAEAVVTGETGILVPSGDASTLAVALGQLMADPQQREAMGKAGRLRVAKHFAAAEHARQVEAVYRELMDPSLLRENH